MREIQLRTAGAIIGFVAVLHGVGAAAWARIDPFDPTAAVITTTSTTSTSSTDAKNVAPAAPAPAPKPAKTPSLSQFLPSLRGLSISAKLAAWRQALAARLEAVTNAKSTTISTPPTPTGTATPAPIPLDNPPPPAEPPSNDGPVLIVPGRPPLISPHR